MRSQKCSNTLKTKDTPLIGLKSKIGGLLSGMEKFSFWESLLGVILQGKWVTKNLGLGRNPGPFLIRTL